MTTPSTQEFLNAAALRTTSTKPEFVGYWLAKNCLTDKLTPEQLATKLATDLDGFARLSLCRTPHPDTFNADVNAVGNHAGVDVKVLVNVLRQEWAIAGWVAECDEQAKLSATNQDMPTLPVKVTVTDDTPRPHMLQQTEVPQSK